MEEFKANPGKNLTIELDGQKYARLPLQTKVVTKDDTILAISTAYAQPFLKPGDFLFISEKIVAISQGRAFPIKEIKPSFLAKFLVTYVYKSPHGIGLGSPWTMELAIREAGAVRILFAAFCSAVTKPFGIRGVFYKVAGHRINAIDGPTPYTLPPYNEYAKLPPAKPEKVASELAQALGHDVVIIDANDLGVNVLGKSNAAIEDSFCQKVFKDNPLGQTTERTPLCIVRRVDVK
ncbi:MAG: coenzyme F420-0:L-glutamate ligase [bacterium]